MVDVRELRLGTRPMPFAVENWLWSIVVPSGRVTATDWAPIASGQLTARSALVAPSGAMNEA